MSTFLFDNKQKKIKQLQSDLSTVIADRDKLLETVKEFESKMEQSKQTTAAFSLGANAWETEKTSLIEAHTKALGEMTKTLDDKAKLVSEMQLKFQSEKDQLIKDHTAAVEKLKEEHKAEVIVTDEKVSKSAAVKLNTMNLSEGDLPAFEEKETLTIETARKTLASLSGKERNSFFKQHKQLFDSYLKTSQLPR